MRHGERPEHERVGDGEHRGVRADPEGERRDDERREGALLRQTARCVTDVLQESLPPLDAPDAPHSRPIDPAELRARGAHVAEAPQCFRPRVRWRESLRLEVTRLHLEMERQLVAHLVGDTGGGGRKTEQPAESGNSAHGCC
jgi:hypothetical protein